MVVVVEVVVVFVVCVVLNDVKVLVVTGIGVEREAKSVQKRKKRVNLQ